LVKRPRRVNAHARYLAVPLFALRTQAGERTTRLVAEQRAISVIDPRKNFIVTAVKPERPLARKHLTSAWCGHNPPARRHDGVSVECFFEGSTLGLSKRGFALGSQVLRDGAAN
jgi:hypothetical protein